MTLQALFTTDKGTSQATVLELEEYKLTILETTDEYVRAQGTKEQLATATYYAQTITDALIILAEDTSPQDTKIATWPQEAKEIIKKDFAVRSQQTTHSQETNKAYGATIKEQLGLPVNLTNPTTRIVPYQTQKGQLLTVALTNKDLSKREYRIFTSNTSLKATIAASILRLAGYNNKKMLLLPYETDGTLAIEAAMQANKQSPHHYEGIQLPWPHKEQKQEQKKPIHVTTPSVQHLKATQKNAKIAGILKQLTLTKAELDWLDTKHDKNSQELMIAQLPTSGKKTPKKVSDALAKELAYQAKHLLKKKGSLTVITTKPQEHKSFFEQAFTKNNEQTIYMGEQELTLLTYEVK